MQGRPVQKGARVVGHCRWSSLLSLPCNPSRSERPPPHPACPPRRSDSKFAQKWPGSREKALVHRRQRLRASGEPSFSRSAGSSTAATQYFVSLLPTRRFRPLCPDSLSPLPNLTRRLFPLVEQGDCHARLLSPNWPVVLATAQLSCVLFARSLRSLSWASRFPYSANCCVPPVNSTFLVKNNTFGSSPILASLIPIKSENVSNLPHSIGSIFKSSLPFVAILLWTKFSSLERLRAAECPRTLSNHDGCQACHNSSCGVCAVPCAANNAPLLTLSAWSPLPQPLFPPLARKKKARKGRGRSLGLSRASVQPGTRGRLSDEKFWHFGFLNWMRFYLTFYLPIPNC